MKLHISILCLFLLFAGAISGFSQASINGLNTSYCEGAGFTEFTVSPIADTGAGEGSEFSPNGAPFTVDLNTGQASFDASQAVLDFEYEAIYTFVDGSGSSKDTVYVTVHSNPVASISGLFASYCADDDLANFTVSPTGGFFSVFPVDGAFNVNVVAGMGTFDPDAGTPGTTYDVDYQFSDANSCFDNVSLQVVLNDVPMVTITGIEDTYCANDPMINFSFSPTLSMGAGGEFTVIPNDPASSWDENAGTGTFDPAQAVTGQKYIFQYTFIDNNFCRGIAKDSLIVNPVASPQINGLFTDYCEDEGMVEFSVSPTGVLGTFTSSPSDGAFTVNINTGVGTFDPSQGTPGTSYNLSYSFADGCSTPATQTVNFNELPTVTITGVEDFYCANDPEFNFSFSPLFSEGAGGEFTVIPNDPASMWDENAGTGTFNPMLATTGLKYIFQYTFIDNNFCRGIAKDSLIVNPAASAQINGLLNDYCEDQGMVEFSVSPAGNLGTFTSSPSDGAFTVNINTGVGTFDPSLGNPGTSYDLTYTFVDGCSTPATQTVNFNELPTVTITGVDDFYCADDPVFNFSFSPLFSEGAGGEFTVIPNDPASMWDENAGTGTFDPTQAAIGQKYIFQYTFIDNNFCRGIAKDSLIVNPAASAQINGLLNDYCEDQGMVEFSVSPAGGLGTFISSPNDGAFTVNISTGVGSFDPSQGTPGTSYNLSYSFADGCSTPATQTVNYNANPTVTISGLNSSYCISEPSVNFSFSPLISTGAGGEFTVIPNDAASSWNEAAGTGTFDPAQATLGSTYMFQYTYIDNNFCSAIATYSLIVNSGTAASINGLNSEYCTSDNLVNFSVSPNGVDGTFTVSPNDGSFTIDEVTGSGTFDPSVGIGGTTYDLSYTFADGCTGSGMQQVILKQGPDIMIGGLDAMYCSGEGNKLFTFSPPLSSGSGEFTVIPNDGATAIDFSAGIGTFNPSLAEVGTEYLFQYTFFASDGCGGVVTHTATVIDPQVGSITGLNSNYGNLDASSTISGTPSTGTFTSSIPGGIVNSGNGTATFNPSAFPAGGPYVITYNFTDMNGCSSSVSQEINVINSDIPVTFTGLNDEYCSSDPLVTLTGFPINESSQFFSNSPSGFTDNGDGTANIDLSLVPTGSTFLVLYSYTDTDSGASGNDEQSFIVKPAPQVGISGIEREIYCIEEGLIQLEGSPASPDGEWIVDPGLAFEENGTGSATINISSTPVGVYNVTYQYTNPDGCFDSFTESIAFTNGGVATFSGLENLECGGGTGSIQLVGSPAGGMFTSIFGEIENGLIDLDLYPKDFPIVITYVLGPESECSGSSMQTVIIPGIPDARFFGLDQFYNDDDSDVVINGAQSNGVFTSSDPLSLQDNGNGTATFSPTLAVKNQNIMITYTVTDLFSGCTNSESRIVSVFGEVIVGFTQLPTSFCDQDSFIELRGFPLGGVFTSTEASGFFGDELSLADIQLGLVPTDVPITITYTFVTAGTGEVFTSEQTFIKYSLPNVQIIGLTDGMYCENGPDLQLTGLPSGSSGVFTIDSNIGLTDEGNGEATLTLNNLTPRTYVINYTYTDSNGCSNSSDEEIEILALPDAEFIGLLSSYCSNELVPLQLTSNFEGGQFMSSQGISETGLYDLALFEIGVPQEITYEIVGEFGCTNRSTQSFIINAAPDVEVSGVDETYCLNQTDDILLTGSPAASGGTFTFSENNNLVDNGDGTGSIDLEGLIVGLIYEVSYAYEDDNGCSSSTNSVFTLVDTVAIELAEDVIFCDEGGIVEILNPDAFESFLWSNGATSSAAEVIGAGVYSVSATDSNGCIVSSEIKVTVNPGEEVLSNYLVADGGCVGDDLHFVDITETEIISEEYIWDFGDGSTSSEQDPVHRYNDPGSYEVSFIARSTGCVDIVATKTIEIAQCQKDRVSDSEIYVEVKPNPNVGNFVVYTELENKGDLRVELVDINGRKKMVRSYRDVTEIEFDVTDISDGLYFLFVRTSGSVEVRKVVVGE